MKQSDFIFSTHARMRVLERGIKNTDVWAARREALRTNLRDSLQDQHKKLASMLTEKDLNTRIGKKEFRITTTQITTRIDVNGVKFVVGIKREGDDYTPLTIATVAWN